jgi:hypothetical protein
MCHWLGRFAASAARDIMQYVERHFSVVEGPNYRNLVFIPQRCPECFPTPKLIQHVTNILTYGKKQTML